MSAAVLVGLVMVGLAWPPFSLGPFGSLLQTLLPWFGVSVLLMLGLAVLYPSRRAATAALVPALVWSAVFGGQLIDKQGRGGDLTVVSHKVHDSNPEPDQTAHDLAAAGPDLLALEELTPRTIPVYEKALAAVYPFHVVRGTVGLWSVYPLRDAQTVPIMAWPRALRVSAETPQGQLTVYVADLASVRVSLLGRAHH
ncbi:hypothetical protein ACH41H_46505 [Streptomyces sp. NPDC020800]|uniref:hypothetical protein n=1 Tax=Streptomyces sp. NPDC020800 TaxID=3365092 RepID=UPI0037B4780A